MLATGAGIVLLGTMEFSIREHLSGYRSHTILLAFLPTVMFHTAGVLLLAQVLGVSTAPSVIAPLVLDLPVFAFLFRLLRARYLDARRERAFARAEEAPACSSQRRLRDLGALGAVLAPFVLTGQNYWIATDLHETRHRPVA